MTIHHLMLNIFHRNLKTITIHHHLHNKYTTLRMFNCIIKLNIFSFKGFVLFWCLLKVLDVDVRQFITRFFESQKQLECLKSCNSESLNYVMNNPRRSVMIL